MSESIKDIQERTNTLNKFSMSFFDLTNKVAIVTGGNTGLGQAYTVALATAGADILVATYGQEEWDATRKIVESKGRRVEFLNLDLTQDKAPQEVVQTALDKFGRLDILINNAGMIKRNPLLESTDADWQKVIDINLNVVYHLSMAVAKVFAKQNYGKIINNGTMLSFQCGKFIPAYTASKHRVAGLTKAFASEMGTYNVQVNAIAPGYIKTANTAPIRADKSRNDEILGRIPAKHWGETYELMGVAVFLASDASNYVNGHILAVDGGYLVR